MILIPLPTASKVCPCPHINRTGIYYNLSIISTHLSLLLWRANSRLPPRPTLRGPSSANNAPRGNVPSTLLVGGPVEVPPGGTVPFNSLECIGSAEQSN